MCSFCLASLYFNTKLHSLLVFLIHIIDMQLYTHLKSAISSTHLQMIDSCKQGNCIRNASFYCGDDNTKYSSAGIYR